MESRQDISTHNDIQVLVNTFYDKVRQDDLLGPIFNTIIQDHWPAHLEKMYGFWETMLLNKRLYHGSPFPPHAKMPINAQHFERWKVLFFETVNQNFSGKKADEAKKRAEKMAEIFQIKRAYLQNHQPD